MSKPRPWIVVNDLNAIIARKETEKSARECASSITERYRQMGVQYILYVAYRPSRRPTSVRKDPDESA